MVKEQSNTLDHEERLSKALEEISSVLPRENQYLYTLTDLSKRVSFTGPSIKRKLLGNHDLPTAIVKISHGVMVYYYTEEHLRFLLKSQSNEAAKAQFSWRKPRHLRKLKPLKSFKRGTGMGQSDWEKNEQANRDRAQQRLNMGQDPGGAYGDLRDKYANQQAEQKRNSGGSNSGCFPAGTPVATPLGHEKIECIEIGDKVLSVDPSSGKTEEKRVLAHKVHLMNNIFEVTFDDGSLLRTTSEHSFLVDGRWKKAGNLCRGDNVHSLSASLDCYQRQVQSTRFSSEIETVYNLTTEDLHNFVACGTLAHNFTYFRRTKAFYWKVRVILSQLFPDRSRALGIPKLNDIKST